MCRAQVFLVCSHELTQLLYPICGTLIDREGKETAMVQEYCALQSPPGVDGCLPLLYACKQHISYCTRLNTWKRRGCCTLVPT